MSLIPVHRDTSKKDNTTKLLSLKPNLHLDHPNLSAMKIKLKCHAHCVQEPQQNLIKTAE